MEALKAKVQRPPEVADAEDSEGEDLLLCNGLGEDKFIDWMEERDRMKSFKAMLVSGALVLVELRAGRRGNAVDWINNTLPPLAGFQSFPRFAYVCGKQGELVLVGDLSIGPRNSGHACDIQAIIEVGVARSLPQLLACAHTLFHATSPCSSDGICALNRNGFALQKLVALKFYNQRPLEEQPAVAVVFSKGGQGELQKSAISFGCALLCSTYVRALEKAGVTSMTGVGFGGPACDATVIPAYELVLRLPVGTISIDLYDLHVHSINYMNRV